MSHITQPYNKLYSFVRHLNGLRKGGILLTGDINQWTVDRLQSCVQVIFKKIIVTVAKLKIGFLYQMQSYYY